MNAPAVKHPRRLGFIVFNVIVLAVAAALFGVLAGSTGADDVGAMPNVVLAIGGLAVLAVVWIGTWLAWGVLVWRRRRRNA